MCGIFGIIVKKDSKYPRTYLIRVLRDLAMFSESRGKDSSGIVIRDSQKKEYKIFRSACPITGLLKRKICIKNLEDLKKSDDGQGFSIMGHTRLVTNGSQLDNNNNQPVTKDGIIALHNGIIVNVDELWDQNDHLKRKYEIDTEVLLSLIRDKINHSTNSVNAVVKSIEEVKGTVSSAFFFEDKKDFVLTTNHGSLYILSNFKDILIFASEKNIIKSIEKKARMKKKVKDYVVKQVKPKTGYSINMSDFTIKAFNYSTESKINDNNLDKTYNIKISNLTVKRKQLPVVVNLEQIRNNPLAESEKRLLEYNYDCIMGMKRCKKCLLPETFPFITFDNKCVCNYCKNYKLKNEPKPIEELKSIIKSYRIKQNEPNVLVTLSGGRDSCFTLHLVKKVLGLNPITVTYDWGMVTDLARRNIARMCGKLQVENIIVSADIKKKRININKNIKAWLKRSSLGMIPLFMAGDKYFFYHVKQVKKQTGINLNIWGNNALETTQFKAGFGGLRPVFPKEVIYGLTLSNHYRLWKFVIKNVISNPSYINTSILDTLGSYFVKYLAPRKDYFRIFDYYRWNEKEIEDTLRKEYDWESAIDTPTTWRIGDGTASFYNYIYYNIAGFTESETFRSNQIREGLINRKEGLEITRKENFPRYESIKWYLEIVGLDFKETITRINRIRKLYR